MALCLAWPWACSCSPAAPSQVGYTLYHCLMSDEPCHTVTSTTALCEYGALFMQYVWFQAVICDTPLNHGANAVMGDLWPLWCAGAARVTRSLLQTTCVDASPLECQAWGASACIYQGETDGLP